MGHNDFSAVDLLFSDRLLNLLKRLFWDLKRASKLNYTHIFDPLYLVFNGLTWSDPARSPVARSVPPPVRPTPPVRAPSGGN